MVLMHTNMCYTHCLSRHSLCSHSKEKVNVLLNKKEGGDFSSVLSKGNNNFEKRGIIAYPLFTYDLG